MGGRARERSEACDIGGAARQLSPASSQEPFIAHFQQDRVGPIFAAARHMYSVLVKPLQAVNQHRPVLLLEDVAPNLDDSVRAHADEQSVECGVMQLAERKPVRHPWLSPGFTVWHDVGGVEQFVVPEAAQRTLRSVRTQHTLPKGPLMEPDLEFASHVSTPLVTAGFVVEGHRWGRKAERQHVQHRSIVDLDRELETFRLISDNEYRPSGEVAPRKQTEEVDQRDPPPHQLAEPDVVPMHRIPAAIRIEETSIAARPIVVGSIDRCPHRKRQLARARLEDALHADQGHADFSGIESLAEYRPRKDVIVPRDLLGEPIESSPADGGVTHGCTGA